jgi:hypothetical protein
MSAAAVTEQKRKGRSIRLWLLIAAALALVFAANAHLVYVATTSQPACVAHVRQGEGSAGQGSFSAAQSSCSPVRQGAPS